MHPNERIVELKLRVRELEDNLSNLVSKVCPCCNGNKVSCEFCYGRGEVLVKLTRKPRHM